MMNMLRTLFAGLLALGSFSVSGQVAAPPPTESTPLSVAIENTPFITEHKPNPHARYYMYFFTASWCSPCRAVTPKIIAEYPAMMRNRHMELILVSFDDTPEQALAYLRKYHAPFAVIMYTSLQELALPGCPADVNAIPHIVVVDNHGRLIYRGHALRYAEWKDRTSDTSH